MSVDCMPWEGAVLTSVGSRGAGKEMEMKKEWDKDCEDQSPEMFLSQTLDAHTGFCSTTSL
jgi:hypothetical protein